MDSAPHFDPTGYHIGDVTVDLETRQVRRNGENIQLGKLSYTLLVTLAEAAPGVVMPDTLAKRVWQGRFVSPPTIKQRIALLRQALGDDAKQPRYVKVVRGHGYTLVPSVKPVFGHTSKRRIGAPIFVGVVIGAILLGVLFFGQIVTGLSDRSILIAVLPFENLSPKAGDQYFATGLHQEMNDRLARIPNLQVISRASLQQFARSATPVEDVSREFGVDAVMEGTVKYQDDRVRISIHLVDPARRIQFWSNTYERDFSDIFEIQRDIATSVAGALGVRLGIAEIGTSNPEAYEFFLAGLDMMGRPNGQDRGAFFFGEAISIDPEFASAWAQLGFATVIRAYFAPAEQAREILEDALGYLLKATKLDPQSARALASLGFVRYSLFDWIGAEKEFKKAITMDANSFVLDQYASLLVRSGRISAAKSEFDAAESVNPSRESPGQLRRHVSIVQESYAEARELVALDRTEHRRLRMFHLIALNEGKPDVIRSTISALVASQGETGPLFLPVLDRFDSPDRALATIKDVYGDSDLQWTAKPFDIALLAAYFGDPELALDAISADVRLSTVRLPVLWHPIMRDVRQLPGFRELVSSLGLVAYWRAYGWPDNCAPVGEADLRCW